VQSGAVPPRSRRTRESPTDSGDYRRRVSGPFDKQWTIAVCAACDPVFTAADVGFVRQVQTHPTDDTVGALLWEADPARFAARYPDSGIVRSYGDQWPAPCIDYWVYVDAAAGQARLSVEGWSLGELSMNLAGDGARDGLALAEAFATILRVPKPRP
jgi:hypothetical protein